MSTLSQSGAFAKGRVPSLAGVLVKGQQTLWLLGLFEPKSHASESSALPLLGSQLACLCVHPGAAGTQTPVASSPLPWRTEGPGLKQLPSNG